MGMIAGAGKTALITANKASPPPRPNAAVRAEVKNAAMMTSRAAHNGTPSGSRVRMSTVKE